MGLLIGALAGGIKGLGDGMIDKAKADREAAIVALAEQNKRTDQQTEFAHSDKQQTALFGHEDTAQQAGFEQQGFMQAGQQEWQGNQNDANRDQQAADAQLAAKTSTANAAAAQTGETARNTATIDAGKSEVAGAPITDANGNSYTITKGGTVTQIKTAAGKPITMPYSKVPAAAIATAMKESQSDPTDPSTFDPQAFQNKMGALSNFYTHGATPLPAGPPPPAPGIFDRIGNMFSGGGSPAPAASRGLLTPGGNASAPPKTPPPPPAIAKIPGLQYSPSQKLYRDPATNKTYDASGNPVK